MERKAMNDFLTSLQLKGDIYMKQLIIERKRVADLDQAIAASSEQIDEYRERTKQSAIGVLNLHRFTKNPAYQRADGWNPTKAADALQRKQVTILEERLNKLKIRNAETDNYNNSLKHQIDDLRKSRMVIDATHAKYERWMRDLRNKILDTLKEATAANEKRDKAVDNRNNLIMKNTAERKEFEAFYLQTGAEIDRQNKLFEESIATAAQQLEASLKSAMKAGSQDEDGNTSIDTPNRLAEELKIKKLQNAQFQLKKDELSQKVEDWKSKIQGLLESTDHTDEETLMETFTKKETETFSLFNFIQQINQDLENVEMAHAKLKEEMEKDKAKQESDDAERKKTLDEKKSKLKRTVAANKKASRGQQIASDSVEKVARKVQSLFFKIQLHNNQGADGSDTKKISGSDGKKSSDGNDGKGGPKSDNKKTGYNDEMTLTRQNCNDTNIIDYLRVIEKRLIHILNEYSIKVIKDDVEKDNEAQFKSLDERAKRDAIIEKLQDKTGGPTHPKLEDGSMNHIYQAVIKEVEQLTNTSAQSPRNNGNYVQEVITEEEGGDTLGEDPNEMYSQHPSDVAKGIDEELKTLSLTKLVNIGTDGDDNIATALSDVDQFQKALWGQKLPSIGNAPGAK